jgi:hypothetical protein
MNISDFTNITLLEFHEKVIEQLSLHNRSRKTVEQCPEFALVALKFLSNDAHDQVIGRQPARIDVGCDPTRQCGVLAFDSSQHLSGGKMRNLQLLDQPSTLRSFPRSGRADKYDQHERGPFSE